MQGHERERPETMARSALKMQWHLSVRFNTLLLRRVVAKHLEADAGVPRGLRARIGIGQVAMRSDAIGQEASPLIEPSGTRRTYLLDTDVSRSPLALRYSSFTM